MFSAVSKAFDYLLGSSESTTQSNGEWEDSSGINTSEENQTAPSQREFEGVVTHVFSSHGLIDDEVYFSFDEVLGSACPSVGDSVSVLASQQYEGGGWHAKQVTLIQNWNDGTTDGHGSNIDNNISVSNSWNTVGKDEHIVGQVTYCSSKTGYVGNDAFYNLDECECKIPNYIPAKGDWVKVTVKIIDEQRVEKVVLTIEPLRVSESEGVVTGELEDHGYIDGEVYYVMDHMTLNGYRPQKWDAVFYKAVESNQGKCSWRAFMVEQSKKPQVTRLNILQGPLRKSFTEELLADKDGVTVTQEADFGTVSTGTKKTITLWVKNSGTCSQMFQRCHMTASSTQMSVTDVKIVQEESYEAVKGETELKPGMAMFVKIELHAKFQGLEKQLLVCTFENFKIGRYVTGYINDSMSDLLTPSEQYEATKQQGYSRYRTSRENKTSQWLVPGQRPNRNKKMVKYPNRLPHYDVEDRLHEAVLDQEDLAEYSPVLTQELCYGNYREKFKLLLHLEEVQMNIDIREFDQHRECLRHVGEYLALRVPGLAEGRPSVLLGDKVILTAPGDPDGPSFEGYVHEILKDEVLLKFNPEFHRTYTGKDYNVEFTYNRGSLRKSHKATEMAKYLGQNVLYPKTLNPKPSQLMPHTRSSQRQQNTKTPTRTQKNGGMDQGGINFISQYLNDRQRSAVTRILHGYGRPLPYIIFGPPGTGKTVTVVEAILQVFREIPSSRIIACAPSNSAADLLAQRIHESSLVTVADLVRLNALQRSFEAIPECILPYCKYGDDMDVAARYRIVIATCVSTGVLYSLGIRTGHFTHVFIDEAGQATEPESMIAACFVSQTDGQIVLAGDPQQLGPVMRSKHAKTYGLQTSLLERLILTPLYERDEDRFANHGAYDPLLVTKLVNNYRSHPSILQTPSSLFYHGELVVKADPAVTHSFCTWDQLPASGVPVIFHGVRGEDMREGNSPSWFNPMEAYQVVRYTQGVLNTGLNPADVGIITPYRKQVEKIRLLLDKLEVGQVKVGSVEEFQGQERPVIIISTVRSNEDMIGSDERHALGFLSNPKRFNVAITRAQALLIVIGNPYVLSQDKYWKAFIDFCVDLGCFTGCDLPPSTLDI